MTDRQSSDRDFVRDSLIIFLFIVGVIGIMVFVQVKSCETQVACKAMEAGYEQVKDASGTVLWKKGQP